MITKLYADHQRFTHSFLEWWKTAPTLIQEVCSRRQYRECVPGIIERRSLNPSEINPRAMLNKLRINTPGLWIWLTRAPSIEIVVQKNCRTQDKETQSGQRNHYGFMQSCSHLSLRGIQKLVASLNWIITDQLLAIDSLSRVWSICVSTVGLSLNAYERFRHSNQRHHG